MIKFDNLKATNLSFDIDEMREVSSDTIHAKIIDDNVISLNIRLEIISKANSSINFSTLTIKSDNSGKLVYGALLSKANSGIKVTIVVDSINTKNDKWLKAVASHPNINFYMFEPYSVFDPRTINNIMHDKILTIDSNYGLIGGRNTHDKYLSNTFKGRANDRDVLIFNELDSIKVIRDMNSYFNYLTNYKGTKLLKYKNSNNRIDLQNELLNHYYKYQFESIDVYDKSIIVDNATFVHSPLNRGSKEPIVYNVISELSKSANEVIIQSPYITTSKLMDKYFEFNENTNYTFVTNNISSNPNLSASSNYIKIRNDLANNHKLYEIQSEQSNHAKSLTIDNDIAIIGSQNFDHRSMFLSTESMVVIYSSDFNEALKQSFQNDLDKSLLVNSDGSYHTSTIKPIKEKKFKVFIVKLIGVFSNFFKELL